MKVSKTGYKKNSKDKNQPSLLIPSNRITMKDVQFPVLGTDNLGNQQMMYPGKEYSFPGNYVYEKPMKNWLNKYDDGGTTVCPEGYVWDKKLKTCVKLYTDFGEFKIANQAYQDSSDVYNLSKRITRVYPNLPEITKEEYDRLEEKDNNLPYYELDKVGYEEDKKAKKEKNLKEYVYERKKGDYDHPLYLKNHKKELDKYTVDEEGKYDIVLSDGSIKSPGYIYEGKPYWDYYNIYNPKTGVVRSYFDNKLSYIYSPDIEPIKTMYFGEDKLIPSEDIRLSGTSWYTGKKPSMKELQSWTNYYIPTEFKDVYLKPTQPVRYVGQPGGLVEDPIMKMSIPIKPLQGNRDIQMKPSNVLLKYGSDSVLSWDQIKDKYSSYGDIEPLYEMTNNREGTGNQKIVGFRYRKPNKNNPRITTAAEYRFAKGGFANGGTTPCPDGYIWDEKLQDCVKLYTDLGEYKKANKAYQDSSDLYRLGEKELKRFYHGDPGESTGKIRNLNDLNSATSRYSSGITNRNQLYNTTTDLNYSDNNVQRISSIYNRTGILPTDFWANEGYLNYRFKNPTQPVRYVEEPVKMNIPVKSIQINREPVKLDLTNASNSLLSWDAIKDKYSDLEPMDPIYELTNKGEKGNQKITGFTYREKDKDNPRKFKVKEYRFQKGGFVNGGPSEEMPFGLPLASRNPSAPWAYESPKANGYILPDPNRPALLNTGATEYKMGVNINDEEVTIPTIVNGFYMNPEDAMSRYTITGEKFKEMTDPNSYSQFYDDMSRLGLMGLSTSRERKLGGFATGGSRKCPDGYVWDSKLRDCVKLYDDLGEYIKAKRAYEDSLSLYNQYPLPWGDLGRSEGYKTVPWSEIQKEYENSLHYPGMLYNHIARNSKFALDQKSKNKIAPVGAVQVDATPTTNIYDYVYKKPTQRVRYVEAPVKMISKPVTRLQGYTTPTTLNPINLPENLRQEISRVQDKSLSWEDTMKKYSDKYPGMEPIYQMTNNREGIGNQKLVGFSYRDYYDKENPRKFRTKEYRFEQKMGGTTKSLRSYQWGGPMFSDPQALSELVTNWQTNFENEKNKELQNDLTWHEGWLNSPMYRKMLYGDTPGDYGGNTKEELDRIDAIRRENLEKAKNAQLEFIYRDIDGGVHGSADYRNNKVKLFKLGFDNPTVLTHELRHLLDNPYKIRAGANTVLHIPDPNYDPLLDYENPPKPISPNRDIDYAVRGVIDYDDSKKCIEDGTCPPEGFGVNPDDDKKYFKKRKEYNSWRDYITEQTEINARLAEIRQQAQEQKIYDPYNEPAPKNFFKLFESKGINTWPLKNLRDFYTDDEILYMLNNFSYNDKEKNDTGIYKSKLGGSTKWLDQYAGGGQECGPGQIYHPQYGCISSKGWLKNRDGSLYELKSVTKARPDGKRYDMISGEYVNTPVMEGITYTSQEDNMRKMQEEAQRRLNYYSPSSVSPNFTDQEIAAINKDFAEKSGTISKARPEVAESMEKEVDPSKRTAWDYAKFYGNVILDPLNAMKYSNEHGGRDMPIDYFSQQDYDPSLFLSGISSGAGLGMGALTRTGASAISKANDLGRAAWQAANSPIRNIPGLTPMNLVNLGFGAHGAGMLGSDLTTGYYGSDAPLEDKILRGVETGLNLVGTPRTGNLLLSRTSFKPTVSISRMNLSLPDIADDVNRGSFFDSSELSGINNQIRQGNTWLQNWFNNPATAQRIANTGFNRSPLVRKNINDFIGNKNVVRYDPALSSKIWTGNELGSYFPKLNKAYVDAEHFSFMDGTKSLPSTVIHEGTHLTSAGELAYNQKLIDLTNDIFKGNDVQEFMKMFRTEEISKLISPAETHARIMQIRHQYNIRPDQIVDNTLVNKIIEDGLSGKLPVSKKFFELIKNKDAFKKAMNTLPAIGMGVAIGTVGLQKNKTGGSVGWLDQYDKGGPKVKVQDPATGEVKEMDITSDEYRNLYPTLGYGSTLPTGQTSISIPANDVFSIAFSPNDNGYLPVDDYTAPASSTYVDVQNPYLAGEAYINDRFQREKEIDALMSDANPYYIPGVSPKMSRKHAEDLVDNRRENVLTVENTAWEGPMEVSYAAQVRSDKQAKPLIENNPQGDRTNVEWFNSFTPEQQEILKYSNYASMFEPELWRKTLQGLESAGRYVVNYFNPVNDLYKSYTGQDMINRPFYTIPGYTDETAKDVSPLETFSFLQYPQKAVQGQLTNSSYTNPLPFYTYNNYGSSNIGALNTAANLASDPILYPLIGEMPFTLAGDFLKGVGSSESRNLLYNLRDELRREGIVRSQKSWNLPGKEFIRKGVKPWTYDWKNKIQDLKSLLFNVKNPAYKTQEEIDKAYEFFKDHLHKSGTKVPTKEEYMAKLGPEDLIESLGDVVRDRFKQRFSNEMPLVSKNRYATWDMYLGKPQTAHPMYDISNLTKSKDDIIYTIKERFMNKPLIERRLDEIIKGIDDPNMLLGKTGRTVKKIGDNKWIFLEKNDSFFGTMGGFHWEIERLPNGNYKIYANDTWDLQPFKDKENSLLKNLEIGKTLGIGKPLNVKVGFEVDKDTNKILRTFGLGGEKVNDGSSNNWLDQYDDGGEPCPDGYIKNWAGICIKAPKNSKTIIDTVSEPLPGFQQRPKTVQISSQTMMDQGSQNKKEADPYQKYRQDELGYQNRVYTYATDPQWFDSHANVWENRNSKSDEQWNELVKKKVYAGTHGFNPVTGELIKLDSPVNVPAATQEKSTKDYAKKSYNERMTSNTPAGEENRKAVVAQGMQDMVTNPAFYVPGMIASAPFIGAASSVPLLSGMGTTITLGDALGLGFGLEAAQHLGKDLNTGYYTSDAPLVNKIGNAALTGLGLSGLPGVRSSLSNAYGKLGEFTRNYGVGYMNPSGTRRFMLASDPAYLAANNPRSFTTTNRLGTFGFAKARPSTTSALSTSPRSGYQGALADGTFYTSGRIINSPIKVQGELSPMPFNGSDAGNSVTAFNQTSASQPITNFIRSRVKAGPLKDNLMGLSMAMSKYVIPNIANFSKNYFFNRNRFLSNLNRLRNTDETGFSKIPLTSAQVAKNIQLFANVEKEANDFANMWMFDENGNLRKGRQLLLDKYADQLKNAGYTLVEDPFNPSAPDVGAYPTRTSPRNLINTNELAVGSASPRLKNYIVNNPIISSRSFDEVEEIANEIRANWGEIGGLNSIDNNVNIALTNHGIYWNSPTEVKNTGVHEHGHNIQKFPLSYIRPDGSLGTIGYLKNQQSSSKTGRLDKILPRWTNVFAYPHRAQELPYGWRNAEIGAKTKAEPYGQTLHENTELSRLAAKVLKDKETLPGVKEAYKEYYEHYNNLTDPKFLQGIVDEFNARTGWDSKKTPASFFQRTGWGIDPAKENEFRVFYKNKSQPLEDKINKAKEKIDAALGKLTIPNVNIISSQNWESDINELHSELMSARLQLFEALKKAWPNVKEDAIIHTIGDALLITNPSRGEQENIDRVINALITYGNLNRFFKPNATFEDKSELIKNLLTITALTGASTLPFVVGNEEENKEMRKYGGSTGWLDQYIGGGPKKGVPVKVKDPASGVVKNMDIASNEYRQMYPSLMSEGVDSATGQKTFYGAPMEELVFVEKRNKKAPKELSLEQRVNEWLGNPMQKAADEAQRRAGENQRPGDSFRHSNAGRLTREAIQNKFPEFMKYTGIPQVAGFLGATALGIGHEAVTPTIRPHYSWWDTARESAEDIINNTIGASGLFSEDELYNMHLNNQMPDGYGKGNMYFKQKGGIKTSAEGYYDYINGYKGVSLSKGGSSKKGWLEKYK
jgi:hypothetical protein